MPTLTGKRRSPGAARGPARKRAGIKRVVPSPLTPSKIDLKHLTEVIKSVGRTRITGKAIATEKAAVRRIVSVPVVSISVGEHSGRAKVSRKPAIDHWVVERINKSSNASEPVLKKK